MQTEELIKMSERCITLVAFSVLSMVYWVFFIRLKHVHNYGTVYHLRQKK